MAFGKCTTCDVWRERALAAEERERVLIEKYHSLRLANHEPVGKLRVIPAKADSGMQAIKAGERAITDPRLAKAFAELVRDGLPEADALREAERLVSIGTGRRTAESVASLTDMD